LALKRVPGELGIRFNPEVSESKVAEVLDSINATTKRAYRPARYYWVSQPNLDTTHVVAALESLPEVLYAHTVSPAIVDEFCDPATPTVGFEPTPGSWYLQNSPTYAAFVGGRPFSFAPTPHPFNRQPCESGVPTDCPNPQDQCVFSACNAPPRHWGRCLHVRCGLRRRSVFLLHRQRVQDVWRSRSYNSVRQRRRLPVRWYVCAGYRPMRATWDGRR